MQIFFKIKHFDKHCAFIGTHLCSNLLTSVDRIIYRESLASTGLTCWSSRKLSKIFQ